MKLKTPSILPLLGKLSSALAKTLAGPRLMVFDCEIKRSPQCSADWRDYKRLGLSVFGCYCSWLPADRQWQAFTELDGFAGLQDLIDQAEEIVGFNSLSFDDPLCEAHGIHIKTTFDLMVEVRRAAGEPLSGPCTPGYNLIRLAEGNLGEDLPEVRAKSIPSRTHVLDLWAAGEHEKAIKYCLNDVWLTLELYKRRYKIVDPVMFNRVLHCDPAATDWREIAATVQWFLAERVFNFHCREVRHWTGARIIRAHFSASDALVLSFPVWMLPLKSWRQYTGIPFRLTSKNPAKTDHERELDLIYTYPKNSEGEDADPIPF